MVKGGKKLSFRATVIVGNQNSQVGVGVGKADEVSTAVKKAVNNARKNLIQIPLTKTKTIPHNVIGVDGAIQNILAKQLGGNNLLNNARATIVALKSLKTAQQVAEERDIPLEKIFSYNK